MQNTAPRRSEPPPGEAWRPDEPTGPSPQVRRRSGQESPQSLRHELREAQAFSFPALLLAVGGSVVGTVLTSATGTGPWGSLAGAALAPIVSTTFSTRRAGEKGRVRAAAVLILSAAALLITWAGVSLADLAAGNSVLPGAGERANTFPAPIVKDPTPRSTAAVRQELNIEATTELDCGLAPIGSDALCPRPVTIKNTGTVRLHVTRVEVTGSQVTDFVPGQECANVWLTTDEICTMTVRFHPSAAGPRSVTLVIHQNLPPPDPGTKVSIIGVGKDPDACIEGYVWREAFPADHVCVTPVTRDGAQLDNQLKESRRSPSGGAYGPDTCIEGYVWREAAPSDHVCVLPATRDLAQQDNALRDSRRVG